MTDSRRDFLLRFAAAAVASAGAGCEVAPTVDQPQRPHVVYGAPPIDPRAFPADVGDRVFFDTEKATLRPDAKIVLGKQAEWLKRRAKFKIVVEGHADERGTREYNLALGERRAEAIKTYLVAKGFPAASIETVSYGKERPVALGNNEGAWAQNRRGVIVISE